MAILQGFPPSSTISPSVRITEKDLSYVAPDQSFHRAGLIGYASKGPVNLPTLIQTSRQLQIVFGSPHPETSDPFMLYAAQLYLLVASELYVVRVADTDPLSDESAKIASVEVPSAGDIVYLESSDAGPYNFSNDSFFRWKLNGELSSKTLVVLAGTKSVSDVVDELNEQLDSELDGIEFYISGVTSGLGVRTVWAYGPEASLELVSVQDAIYGGPMDDSLDLTDGNFLDNPTGLGTGMTRASDLGTATQYPDTIYYNSGDWDFTGLTDLNIQLYVDGTDNVLVDGVLQVIDLNNPTNPGSVDLATLGTITTTDVVNYLNDEKTENGGSLPGGWGAVDIGDAIKIVTIHRGVDARLFVRPESTAYDIFGFGTRTAGTTPEWDGVSPTDAYGLARGLENTTGDVTFTITADSPGIEGNSTQVRVTNDVTANDFVVEVFNNGISVESWGNLTKNQASRYYVETYLSLVSDYIRVTDNTSVSSGPPNGVYTLSGGSDGIPSDPNDQDALLIGSKVGYTGLYSLSEPEQFDIDLIAIPGHSSTDVVTEMLNFCQFARQDCLAIVDPPFGLTVKEIIAWQNGTHPLNSQRFDSDFGALYWPWVKYRDTYNQVDVWIPPSGAVMATIARSDGISKPWFAPAGFTRGIVPGIDNVYSRPSLTERDSMYGNRNCINPIVQFVDVDGFVIMGQKTLQRRPTALDRVNVRRMMFYIEKQIRKACRSLLFEPNDEVFRRQFTLICESILEDVRLGRGLTDYRIKADAELNTPDVIDRNEFRAQIGVQPTRAVEFIYLEFSIHRTGSFTENADTF